MLFLALLATLAVAMYSTATTNVQASRNYADQQRARSAADSGLRFMAWRFARMARPKTTIGNITPAVAASLWPSIRTSVANDFATRTTVGERALTWDGAKLSSAPIAVDETAARFRLVMRQHPLAAGDPLDARWVNVASTGTYGAASHTVSMSFRIDKKVKFAIVGKVPIQIGRNTIVEGPMGMATANKYPPYLLLSDFRHLKPALKTKIDTFNDFLAANHNGYDNRVSANNPVEYQKAIDAGYTDYNGDRFVDEYDLFLKEFDADGDRAITRAEFTNPATGKLYDADLFDAIDGLGAPAAGEAARVGYQDGVISNADAYTKVRGTVTMATTANAWQSNLGSSGTIGGYLQGPIQPSDGTQLPVQFGASAADIFDLSPTNFDPTVFRPKTGPENGSSSRTATVLTNVVLSAADANGGTADERTPFGSTSWQATYRRPVFRNIRFKNVRIPKGLNAVFDGCTFEGVTYVELVTNVTTSGGSTTTSASDGMTWSQKMKSGSFSNTTVLTATNSWGFVNGNNLRFNNCTMNGPVVADNPTAYTHFGNSWEFTGATLFDNKADDTATIVAPQTNIEMGSFTAPGTAPSTLVGVVVAGNIDIRGKSVVDGSIIVTGDGAGNTTQGWFGPSDANTDVTTEMPEGGFGRLNIRYNPGRALPDGINVAVDVLPDVTTYSEVPQ
ncbi:MAG TPA: hypothetical protein VF796_27485 [Humisphaera sp.]